MGQTAASAAGEPKTRAEMIDAERGKKEAQLAAERLTRAEQKLLEVKERRTIERISGGVGGLRPVFGGLWTSSGFALGVEYQRDDMARGKMRFRTSARGSTRLWYKIDAEALFPSVAGDWLFADIYAVHHNYNSLPYYGPGPDSEKTGRTNYRLEDTALDGTMGVNLWNRLRIGGQMGIVRNNVGPGRDTRFASTETTYPPQVAPGIDEQVNLYRYAGFAWLDYRSPSNRSGGNYIFQFGHFEDYRYKKYSFNRYDIELQQYIPFLNERRVIALRARALLTHSYPGQETPFYMMPALGGSDTLRGYRPGRFYDDNSLLMSAEYRWEVFSGLDMAVFADAGKVSPRRGTINFSNLESDVGFGLRFNVRDQVFMRIDTAFSHEGFQVWFKFNPVFRARPLKTSSAMGEF
jgi:outer membrane protein assembly factor BamA